MVLFSGLKISTDMLAEKLGHKVGESSPGELLELQEIYNSIKDGNSTWSEYVNGKEVVDEETGEISMEDLSPSPEEKEMDRRFAEKEAEKTDAIMEGNDKQAKKEKKEKAKNKERKEKVKDKSGQKDKESRALGDGYINDEQMEILMDTALKVGISASRLQAMIEAEGIDMMEEITTDQFDTWIKRLEALKG